MERPPDVMVVAPTQEGWLPMYSNPTSPNRFWSKVTFTSTCWLWTASKKPGGYGQFKASGSVRASPVYVHRYAYEFCFGPIPEGLQIDHLCHVRHCVNPDHLEAVTQQENIIRAAARITHCPQGHPYNDINTYRLGNRRFCRECHRASNRRQA